MPDTAPAIEPRVTRYEVCAYPYEDLDRSGYVIAVEYAGLGVWAVRYSMRCLSRRTREWVWEPSPSSRRDGWLDEHRWTLDEALTAAAEVAPTLTLMGLTPAACAAHKPAGWNPHPQRQLTSAGELPEIDWNALDDQDDEDEDEDESR